MEEILVLIADIDSLLRDNSNEIPEKMINGSKVENHSYKVRTNWFQGVVGCIEKALKEQYIPTTFGTELNDLLVGFKARRSEGANLVRTTKEEIDTADNLLARVKEYLEKNNYKDTHDSS